MRRLAAILATTILLTSCSWLDKQKHIADAKAAVVLLLNDPESAQFRNVTFMQVDDNPTYFAVVCGQVNSKNSYGGYDGFKPFSVLRPRNGHIWTARIKDKPDDVAALFYRGYCVKKEYSSK